jgi:hypothetical protein
VLLRYTPSPVLGIFRLTCVEVFRQVIVMRAVLLAARYEEIKLENKMLPLRSLKSSHGESTLASADKIVIAE